MNIPRERELRKSDFTYVAPSMFGAMFHRSEIPKKENHMIAMIPMFAAAGWAFLYLLCGGGLGGAVLIFIVLKMIGR